MSLVSLGEVKPSHYSGNDVALFIAIRDAGGYKVRSLPGYFAIDKFQVFLQSTLQSFNQNYHMGMEKGPVQRTPMILKQYLTSRINIMQKNEYERMLHVFDRPYISMV